MSRRASDARRGPGYDFIFIQFIQIAQIANLRKEVRLDTPLHQLITSLSQLLGMSLGGGYIVFFLAVGLGLYVVIKRA